MKRREALKMLGASALVAVMPLAASANQPRKIALATYPDCPGYVAALYGPGVAPNPATNDIIILLDGRRIRDIDYGDEIRGLIRRPMRDRHGDFVFSYDETGDADFVREILRGEVRIILPRELEWLRHA